MGRSETREIWKLEFWNSINLNSIQTNYDKCPNLHLYFNDRNYKKEINPKMYINTVSSDIYHILSQQQFGLFGDIILLIVEYLPYYQDNNCCLLKPSNNGCVKFRVDQNDNSMEIELNEYLGVNDKVMVALLLNNMKLKQFCTSS